MSLVVDEKIITELESKEQFDEIINYLTPLYEELKKSNPDSLEFMKAACYLGRAEWGRGEYEKAEELFAEAAAHGKSKAHPEYVRMTAMARHYLGTFLTIHGKKSEAMANLLEAKALREALSDRSLWSTLNNLAIVYETWMEFTQAILLYEEALNKAMETRNHTNIVLVLANLARVVFLRGDHETAETYLTQFQEVLAQHVEPEKLPRKMSGWILFVEGEFDQYKGNISDAVVKYQQALRIFEDSSSFHEVYITLNRLSYCLLLRGQTFQAYMLVHRCLAGIANQNIVSLLPTTLQLQGEILLEMQQFEAAIDTFSQLQKVAEKYGFQYYKAMSNLGKAKALWSLDENEKALECIEQALELWRAYDYPVLDQAELFFHYSGILSSLGRHDDSLIALNSAEDLLASCTYQPVIHRIMNAYFRGYYYYTKHSWEQAIRHFEESLHVSIRIDQFYMVVRLCFYLLHCYLSSLQELASSGEKNEADGEGVLLDKMLRLLEFLRRVLLSSDPIILTPQIDVFHLKMKFFVHLLQNSRENALQVLKELQTYLQVHHLPQDDLEIYNLRMLGQSVLIAGAEKRSLILLRSLKTLADYRNEVSMMIHQDMGLLECNFCGNLVQLPLKQLKQNETLRELLDAQDTLKCLYCMAPGLETKDLIIPQAIDVLSLWELRRSYRRKSIEAEDGLQQGDEFSF